MINLTNGWNGPYFQTIRWQTYIESFSPLNFTDFPLVNKMVDPRGIPTGGFGKTWKNQGDLTTTQKILRNLQAVHDVDQLLAKKKNLRLPGRDTRCGHGLK